MRKVLVWQHIVLVLGYQTMYRISQDTSFQNRKLFVLKPYTFSIWKNKLIKSLRLFWGLGFGFIFSLGKCYYSYLTLFFTLRLNKEKYVKLLITPDMSWKYLSFWETKDLHSQSGQNWNNTLSSIYISN